MHLTPQQRALMSHPFGWVACGFGSGLSPVAPGTAGSLTALLPWLALRELPAVYYALALVSAFALGVWVCHWAVATLRIKDPASVVWDEFVGQWVALLPLLWLQRGWVWIFAGFILFRIFDIWKPWPVSWADRRIDGGLGIMLDDVIAGIYAASVLALLLRLI
jgi:phosphatidylglycerophosphatase A